MILVVGATGMTGSSICRRLSARGLPVRAMVRKGSPREERIRSLGIEIVHGDMRSRASLDEATRGATAVISTATAMGSTDKSLTLRSIDHDAQLSLVEAATAAGVGRFIQISVSPLLKPTSPLVRYKRLVEAAVKASGMRYTILQPSVFMEVWLSSLIGWDHARGTATIFGNGDAPISWVSLEDVAEMAVRSLDDARLDNKVVPLSGPEPMSPNQVLAVFESVFAKKYRAKRVPRVLLATLGPVVSQFNEMIGSGISLGAQSALGDVFDSPLQRELALPLTHVRQYARQVAVSEGVSVA